MKFYSLWDSGRANAPELVQCVFDCWEREVGAENIRIFDKHDLDEELGQLDIPWRGLTTQKQSNLLRLKLLSEGPSVWFDATLLPLPGAASWIEQMTQPSGFFAFARQASDRPFSTFFFATHGDCPLIRALYAAMLKFHSIERGAPGARERSLRFLRWRRRAKHDTIWSVDPDGGGTVPYYPFFAFHYLFDMLLRDDPDVARIWNATPKVSALRPHLVQRTLEVAKPDEAYDLCRDVLPQSPLHKLAWKKPVPDQLLDDFRAGNVPRFAGV